MEEPVFQSKFDWWLKILFLLFPIGGAAAVIPAVTSGETVPIIISLISVLFIVLILWGVVLPMRYIVRADHIEIRFGRVRTRVLYSEIEGIVPTRNPISSPALSLDRLHIQSGSSLGPNISPADKLGFLKAVAERAPHLTLHGDKLVRGDETSTP